jgi:hypothetical protein
MSYKKQELITIREQLSSPLVLVGVRVPHLFILLCCSIMCLYVLSSVLVLYHRFSGHCMVASLGMLWSSVEL